MRTIALWILAAAACRHGAPDDFERPSLGSDWSVHNGEVGIVKGDLAILSNAIPSGAPGLAFFTREGTTYPAPVFAEWKGGTLEEGGDR